MMAKSEKSRGGWYFFGIVVLIYLFIAVIRPEYFFSAWDFFISIIKRIWWVFILVFVLLVLVNLFITPKAVYKYLGKQSGIKGWIAAVVGGIISTGPIYMWYPLLNELQKHGTRNALVAVFLYNRAVKPALLPLLIFYFGWSFTIVLTAVMIIASVFQGCIVEKILEVV
ncbi:hypothetical protein GF358_02380 [Candidatus Woesearchaeota archaeon]|nr:hypothetical protein [Candidatus Woesearchaeota archaeon]